MSEGTVKWFNTQKGYGFINPDDEGNDVFVHITAVQNSGLTGLTKASAYPTNWLNNAMAEWPPSIWRLLTDHQGRHSAYIIGNSTTLAPRLPAPV